MMQPSFGGASSGNASSQGVTVVFEAGSVVMGGMGGSGSSGYNTTADTQAAAAQFIQMVETGLQKSQVLQNIKTGNTGS
jgi:hypothetical protein